MTRFAPHHGGVALLTAGAVTCWPPADRTAAGLAERYRRDGRVTLADQLTAAIAATTPARRAAA